MFVRAGADAARMVGGTPTRAWATRIRTAAAAACVVAAACAVALLAVAPDAGAAARKHRAAGPDVRALQRSERLLAAQLERQQESIIAAEELYARSQDRADQ